MTKDQILSEILDAEGLADRLLLQRPTDVDLLRLKGRLSRMREGVTAQWPLSEKSLKENANLAMYAFRVLEGGPYENLPNALLRLTAHLG